MEWLRGQQNTCISIICRSTPPRKESYSGLDILRAKAYLDDRLFKFGTDLSTFEATLLYVLQLRALLELLTGSVESMFRMIDQFTQQVDSSWTEAILSVTLQILHHHTFTLKNICPRSLVRSRVAGASNKFPSNTLLLFFLVEAERGEGVWEGFEA